MSARTILIAEDDPDLALGLTRILEGEGFRVAHARHGDEVQRLVREHRPDLVILDVMMPRKDGFEVVRELRARGETMPVLMLTAKVAETDKVLGLGLGADDYITKPFGVAELIARVKAHLRRTRAPAERMQRVALGAMTLDFARQSIAMAGRTAALSSHECAVLRVLAANVGALVTRAQLLDEVWGGDAAVTARVIDFHVTKLRRKFEEVTGDSEPRRIVTVHGSGYKLVE